MLKMKLMVIFLPLIFFPGCSNLSPKSEAKKQKSSKMTKNNSSKSSQRVSIDSDSIQCTLKKDIRTISVNKTNSGCAVNYTKFDETNEIATGQKEGQHCNAVKDKVVTNLTEAGFSCSGK